MTQVLPGSLLIIPLYVVLLSGGNSYIPNCKTKNISLTMKNICVILKDTA
jgi:hypothetical protein